MDHRLRPRAFVGCPALLAGALLSLILGGTGPLPGAAVEPEPLQALHLRGLTARPAALLMSGQAGGSVPLAVLALPVPLPPAGQSAPQTGVAILLEMGLAALSAPSEEDLRSEIYVYAMDAAGAPRGALTQAFTVPAEAWTGEGAAEAVRFLGHLELPPGRYDLRVLVVGRTPDLFGLYRAPLEVPDFSGGEPVLLPPLLPPPEEEGWLRVREAPHGVLRGDPLASLGLADLGLAAWPSARPVLPEGWEGEVVVFGKRMGPLPGDLAGRLQSPGESSMGRASMVSATLAPAAGELERWRLAVRLEPTATGPASWSWETAVDGAALPPRREVWIAAAEGTRGRPWPSLAAHGALAASPEPVIAAGTPEGRQGPPREETLKLTEKDLTRVARGYPRVLRKVGDGRRSEAMGELMELEASIVSGRSLPAVDALRQAELRELAKLAEGHPEILVPVIWLYLDLFERYVREKELLLAAHARILVRRMTDLYLESAQGEEAQRLAADLLTAFAGSLQILSLTTESESALKQAVALRPGHRVALSGLAASHEGARQDAAAIGYLEELLALDPEDAEACTRLGRIQIRMNRRSQAEATLRRCVEATSPPWARTVAYEELALLLGRGGRWAEAVELLEEGRQRLPEEPRLHLLLAYALDRVGQPSAGRQALAGAGLTAGSAGSSPRARYGRWPRELFDGFRRALEPEVERRQTLLARVLGEEVS